MFHYLFPSLSIGLGLQLFLCELAYFRARSPVWEAAARFWTRVFAVNFAVNVALQFVLAARWIQLVSRCFRFQPSVLRVCF